MIGLGKRENFLSLPPLSQMEKTGVLMLRPMSPYLEQELERRFDLFKPWQSTSSPENFLRQHSGSIRAVVGNAAIGADSALIDCLPGLEIVSSYSVGIDKIDLDKCRERGIRVTNTPDVLTDDVADAAIGLALGVMRKICGCDGFVRKGLWKGGEFELGSKFSGKSVGIVGLGRIGSAIAKRAEAFRCRISYTSISKKPSYPNYNYYPSTIDLATHSDILIVSCSLTEQTRHIINRQVLDALGPRGVLINIGRGAHVDEPELVSALLEGRLGGAGLDVFEKEPNVPEELFGLDNVVLLPHVGSDTEETCKDMADLVIGNLEAHFRNEQLLSPVL